MANTQTKAVESHSNVNAPENVQVIPSGKAVGADAYCRDAAVAVETAKGLIAARRAGAAAH